MSRRGTDSARHAHGARPGNRGRRRHPAPAPAPHVPHRPVSVYTIDFWNAEGVYVLHTDFKAVYVGKADSKRLGPRLRDHLVDRFAGRWDVFSWFSLSTLVTTEKRVRAPGQRQVKPKTIIATLEALAILIADPALNRKRETLPAALQAEQVKSPHPKTIRRYLEDILKHLAG